ncbi:hypothetical protein THERMOT_862 [Bathymodiolus thermophilus thioautotrophic gill symbiont]|nr:hypothetical protein THERMOT_862 [Bathymodiolus thermophilus thioautotrophic gill symbiont]
MPIGIVNWNGVAKLEEIFGNRRTITTRLPCKNYYN